MALVDIPQARARRDCHFSRPISGFTSALPRPWPVSTPHHCPTPGGTRHATFWLFSLLRPPKALVYIPQALACRGCHFPWPISSPAPAWPRPWPVPTPHYCPTPRGTRHAALRLFSLPRPSMALVDTPLALACRGCRPPRPTLGSDSVLAQALACAQACQILTTSVPQASPRPAPGLTHHRVHNSQPLSQSLRPPPCAHLL